MPRDGQIIRPTGRISSIADINEARADMIPIDHHYHVDEPRRTWEDEGPFRPQPGLEPVAAFTATVSGLDVDVDASSSFDPEGSGLEYEWDWGDATANGTGSTASHTYGAGGTFTITLLVTDATGETADITQDVTVA
jgi:PKD repeat protein